MPVMTCPNCGTRLAVDSSAAMAFTCPQCLQQMEVARSLPPPAPLPVMSVERETRYDSRAITIALTLLGVGLVIGFVTAAQWNGKVTGLTVLEIVGAAVMLLLCAGIVFAYQSRRYKTEADAAVAWTPQPARDDSAVLDYGRPQPRKSRGRGSTVAALISTFVAGVVTGIGLIILLVLGICGGLFR